jgi:hypothetical protein
MRAQGQTTSSEADIPHSGPPADSEAVGDEDLELLEELMEEENEGLNTRSLLMIILFIAVAAILLIIILGAFGYLAQGEYGGP